MLNLKIHFFSILQCKHNNNMCVCVHFSVPDIPLVLQYICYLSSLSFHFTPTFCIWQCVFWTAHISSLSVHFISVLTHAVDTTSLFFFDHFNNSICRQCFQLHFGTVFLSGYIKVIWVTQVEDTFKLCLPPIRIWVKTSTVEWMAIV